MHGGGTANVGAVVTGPPTLDNDYADLLPDRQPMQVLFTVDTGTGQIKVGATGTTLDHEAVRKTATR